MRRLWLILGTVLTVAALAVSTGVVWAALADPSPPLEVSWRSIPFRGGALTVQADGAEVSVHIEAGQAGSIEIERELVWTGGKPTVSEEWDGGTLRLDGACPGEWRPTGRDCRIRYQVFVPPETDVEATTNAMLSISRMRGDVSLTSARGTVGVHDVAGDLRLRSETGDILADSLRSGTVDAETGTGTVRLSFEIPPSDVRATVRATGDIELALPQGVYDVTASAPKTDVDSRLNPSSSHKVHASTPEGDIRICC
ncbi:DUF4097 family beta strand repeat-containing protein [Nonomuraea sp. MCN248]|uniref:DUF4097 family beta strand repeat-containing protein n=1 Tax=Nonomuraea corallina TaxID=2989783 RepID=A0ABT4SCN9_9ACTN|nr:DUF4097 family beta strand repeat-containing protein [Nonomuraea corallina]MDA0634937.1 DUF4097 family beta strand repeat-containing protein [Nonomuraea corallina]